jgi:hypothetical protein
VPERGRKPRTPGSSQKTRKPTLTSKAAVDPSTNAIMCAVDDLAGLDRLDWWLNAQRGPRRLLLLWLDAYPLGFALCYALWACWAFKGDFGRAALGAGAVAPLARSRSMSPSST